MTHVMVSALFPANADRAYSCVVPKRFEPHCRAALESLVASEPLVKDLSVDFAGHHTDPERLVVVCAKWEGGKEATKRRSDGAT